MLLSKLNLLATAPDGVAKLRELILTLAVQGKLVPQDAKDESASVLLKKILAEKDQLIAAGKIKRDKPLAEIAEEEPFELPVGWEWVRMGDLIELVSGQHLGPSEYVDGPGASVPYLTGPAEFGAVSPEPTRSTHERRAMAIQNDILITVKGSGVGKLNVVTQPELAISRQLMAIRPVMMDSKFLMVVLKTMAVQFQEKSVGIAIPGIGRDDVTHTAIGLPPLAEQSRIVTRVEELMRLCDALEVKARLEATQHEQLVRTLLGTLTTSTTPEELTENWHRAATHFDLLLNRPEAVDALEQTILQLAVRGLLVPQDPQDEPASELLKKIRTEKDRLIADGKIKRDKPLPPIADDEQPFALPMGWEWVRVGQISSRVQYGVTASADHASSGPRFVRITDIQDDRVNWATVPGMQGGAQDGTDHVLENGDLLIARTGGTIGKSFLVSEVPCDAVFASYLIRISPMAEINPSYMKVFASSEHYWRQLYAKSMGTGQPNVNGTALSELTMPLPPLAEQSRIVACVASLRALCADLRQRLTTARTQQALLAEVLVKEVA